ncbi:MAG: MaoC/PaaZ C-terminal domain-containing protein [Propionicimonas sp.]|nr:MaoC/PaaZ C-terminal domain-containing protein [Propionicimonas sp.]
MTVVPGAVLPGFSTTFTRADLVRYAGASTDFNPIHWSDTKAAELGLPGVVAHGMLTMGMALRVVTDWIGDPGRVRSYAVRFTRPVVVDEVAGGTVEFSGTVTSVEDDIATVTLQAVHDGTRVLGAATVEVFVG